MRIISGKLKGESISFLRSNLTRPLKDSVKENIFNIIIHSNRIKVNLNKSNVLDLYSGIGSFGLEALSRGAKKVTFIEKNQDAVEILKKNLFKFKLKDKSVLIETDIDEALDNKKLGKFDIIFLDPPFSSDAYLNNIKKIVKNNLYKKDHLIIIHREKRSRDNLNNYLDVFLEKKYGRSKILFSRLV